MRTGFYWSRYPKNNAKYSIIQALEIIITLKLVYLLKKRNKK